MTKRKIILTLIMTAIMLVAMTAAASAASYSPYKTGKVTPSEGLNVRATASETGVLKGTIAKGTAITLKGYTKSNGVKWYQITYSGSKAYVCAEYVEKVATYSYTIYTPVKYGKITADPCLKVRSSASSSGKVLGKLYKGKKVILKGYKGNWYRITYNGKAGYISKKYVDTITKAEYTGTKTVTYSSDKYGKVTADPTLNMRKSASSKATVLKQIKKGEGIVLKGYKTVSGAKWYKTVYDNATGYVSAKYVETITKDEYSKLITPVVTPTVVADQYGKVKANPCLTVRASASSSSDPIGYLMYGKKIVIKGTEVNSSGSTWYKINYSGETGYVSASWVQLISKSEYDGISGSEVAAYAKDLKGKSYKENGAGPDEFDSSGLVVYVYDYFGATLPHNVYDLQNYGTPVSYSQAKEGDVICYDTYVGIYIGDDKMVYASKAAGCVVETDITYKNIISIRRIAN